MDIQGIDEAAEHLKMGVRRMHKFGLCLVQSPELGALPPGEQQAKCSEFACMLLGLEPTTKNKCLPVVSSLARTIMDNTFPAFPEVAPGASSE